MKALELKIPPAVLIILFAILVYACRHFGVITWLPNSARIVMAILFLAIASVLFLGSVWAFVCQKTTVDPRTPDKTSALVVNGFYRFTRNPIYLGFCCLLLALAIWLSNWPSLVWVIAFAAYLTYFQIIPEERFLQQKFGDQFQDYCKRVNRWIGW
jgi:protein-S-isoprenylcysteine O-methyltransferase Ste14